MHITSTSKGHLLPNQIAFEYHQRPLYNLKQRTCNTCCYRRDGDGTCISNIRVGVIVVPGDKKCVTVCFCLQLLSRRRLNKFREKMPQGHVAATRPLVCAYNFMLMQSTDLRQLSRCEMLPGVQLVELRGTCRRRDKMLQGYDIPSGGRFCPCSKFKQ